MLGMIGDRLRRLLEARARTEEATTEANNGQRRVPSEMDDANAGAHGTRDMIVLLTTAGLPGVETPAAEGGLAREANDED